MRRLTRIARKYGGFGRFPVVENRVLQYNIEPGTESLDVCLMEGLSFSKINYRKELDYGRADHYIRFLVFICDNRHIVLATVVVFS